MNVPEYIKLAKRILNEDAGSEGMVYEVEAKSGLKAIENEIVAIDEVKSQNGITVARAQFAYPHDYGFALNAIKQLLEGIEITALKLVY